MKMCRTKAAFVMMAVMAMGMTGCSTVGKGTGADTLDTGKPAVSYMIASGANTKHADSSTPLVSETMMDVVSHYGQVYMVRVDGQSDMAAAEDLKLDDRYKSASSTRLKRVANARAAQLLEELDGVEPKFPEVDYLEGFRSSSSALKSLDDSYTSRTIVVSGSGLQTAGYLDFQKNYLSAEPEAVVAMLKECEALPDLSGITVKWVGLGQVKEPQEKLTPRQENNLKDIWQAVIEASGGTLEIDGYTLIDDTESDADLPSVTPIDFPEDLPQAYEAESMNTQKDDFFRIPCILGEDQVQFIGDEANYLDPEGAVETIRPIAQYLAENESVELLVIGSTAGDITNESTLRLSQERAETVKNTLMDLGVDGHRLTAIGMGSDDPWHIKDAGYEGPSASQNRKVALLDAETEQAQMILDQ